MRQVAINKRWFDSQLAAREISQRKLAGLMGMDPSAMSLMLNGKRKMTAQEAGEVARLLSVSVEEVMRHAGIAVPSNRERTLPVAGSVEEDGRVVFGHVPGPRTVVSPPECGDGCQALRVRVPGPLEGWLVFYRPIDGVSLEAVGRMCVAQVLGEDRHQLVMVRRGYEAGYHVLTSLYGGGDAHVRLESAAPVIWMRQ